MRKTPRLKSTSRGIDSSELARVSGSGNLSVNNLIVSIGVAFDSQIGPR